MAIQGDKTINAVCNKTKCFTPTMSKTEIESAIATAKTEIQSGTVANATQATNATKVNNLEITKDENGVLRIGDVIIPQKKLLWEGSEQTGSASDVTKEITLNTELKLGDLLEIKGRVYNEANVPYTFVTRIVYENSGLGTYRGIISLVSVENADYSIANPYIYFRYNADTSTVTVSFTPVRYYHSGGSYGRQQMVVEKIYKVIE